MKKQNVFQKIAGALQRTTDITSDNFHMRFLKDLEPGSKVDLDVCIDKYLNPMNLRMFPFIRAKKLKISMSKGIDYAVFAEEEVQKEMCRVVRITLSIAKQIAEHGFKVTIKGMGIIPAENMLITQEKKFDIAATA